MKLNLFDNKFNFTKKNPFDFRKVQSILQTIETATRGFIGR